MRSIQKQKLNHRLQIDTDFEETVRIQMETCLVNYQICEI